MDDSQTLLKKLNRRTRFTQFLVWIALFFTALGIAAGYKNWLRIHDKAKAGLAGISEIREQIPSFANKEQVLEFQSTISGKLNSSHKHIEGALKELRQIQDSTQHIADSVYTQVEALTIKQEVAPNVKQVSAPHDWTLSEVHFLLQTAIQVLTIKHDKLGAIKALNLADQILLKRASIKLLPLRKEISRDLALVKQYSPPNITLLSEEISKLQDLLEPKQLLEEEMVRLKPSIVKENKNKISAVSEEESLVSRVKKTLNEAVIVQKFDKPLHDEMSKESKKSLYQLLSLRLETLRIMLLQEKDKSYHSQIERIIILLRTFYADEDSRPLIKKLNELNSIDLVPGIPDITTSLTLLESLQNKGNLN